LAVDCCSSKVYISHDSLEGGSKVGKKAAVLIHLNSLQKKKLNATFGMVPGPVESSAKKAKSAER
jgi:hypothetical protein